MVVKMFNSKIVEAHERYLDWFQREQDKTCDYDMQPLNYDEFEDLWIFQHEND
jgi:hypothetical protein